jgi:hypothetical protein
MRRPHFPSWLSVLGLLGACAQELPGTAPELDQLFYPSAMILVPGTTEAEDRIVVSNSNFDQRYNASTVMTLSVDELFAISEGLALDAPNSTMPVKSAVRVPSLSGELAFVASSSGSAEGRVFVSSRGQNRLLMLNLSGGTLDCSNGDVELDLGLDCTRGHIVDSGGSDPFALVHLPASQGSGWMATAHLRITDRPREEIRPDIGIVTFADIDLFEQRLLDEAAGNVLTNPILKVTVPSLNGVSGLAAGKHDAPAGSRELILADLNPVSGAISVWEVDPSETDLTVRSASKVILGAEANISSTRGMVTTTDKERLYVSVRFSEGGGAFNAGIAIMARDGAGYRLLHVYEFGSELGHPTLRETSTGRRLLYLGDIRGDQVWILDVTTDAPQIVGELTGRVEGRINGEPARLRIFDGPTSIVFASRGAKTLGFVGNFTNSTLAIIDVSDADPRKHRVLGRLGRVIEPDGTNEEDNAE